MTPDALQLTPVHSGEQGSVPDVHPLKPGQLLIAALVASRPDVCGQSLVRSVVAIATFVVVQDPGNGPQSWVLFVSNSLCKPVMPAGDVDAQTEGIVLDRRL